MLSTLQDNAGGGGRDHRNIYCLQLQHTKPCIKQFTSTSVNAFKSGTWYRYLHFTDESVILVDFGEQGLNLNLFYVLVCMHMREKCR